MSACRRVLRRAPSQMEVIREGEGVGAFSRVDLARISDPALNDGHDRDILAVIKNVEATPQQLSDEEEGMKRVSNVQVYAAYPVSAREGRLIQEYLPGQDLDELRGKGDWDFALGLWVTLLLTLQRASEKGVTHRDVKPQNIRYHKPGRLMPEFRLIDFNLACSVKDMDDKMTRCQDQWVAGTRSHFSPWQLSLLGALENHDSEHLHDLLDEIQDQCVPTPSEEKSSSLLKNLFLRNDLWSSAVTVFEYIVGRLPPSLITSSVSQDLRTLRPDRHFPSATAIKKQIQDSLLSRNFKPPSWFQANVLAENLALALDPLNPCVTASDLLVQLIRQNESSPDLQLKRILEHYISQFDQSLPQYCENDASSSSWTDISLDPSQSQTSHPWWRERIEVPSSRFKSFEELIFGSAGQE